jgi:hypothetical protein
MVPETRKRLGVKAESFEQLDAYLARRDAEAERRDRGRGGRGRV